MRWVLSQIGYVLRALFVVLLLALTGVVGLMLGGDVYVAARLSPSSVIRQFEYANRKNVDATAILQRAISAQDLREYTLESVLQAAHGFKCQPINGVSRCLYVKRGRWNCVHSIGIDLLFDAQQNLSSAIGESYISCDG